MRYIRGNLLTYEQADVICQQNNCWTRKPHGLSKAIQNKFSYVELYKRRPGKTPNIASTPDVPGKCHLFSKKGSVTVACLLGQWRPGVPGKWDHVYPEHEELKDTYEQRVEWFREALGDMGGQLDTGRKWVVAFPYKIGCGLAGGDWAVYSKLIVDFERMFGHIEVHVVVLPKEYEQLKQSGQMEQKSRPMSDSIYPDDHKEWTSEELPFVLDVMGILLDMGSSVAPYKSFYEHLVMSGVKKMNTDHLRVQVDDDGVYSVYCRAPLCDTWMSTSMTIGKSGGKWLIESGENMFTTEKPRRKRKVSPVERSDLEKYLKGTFQNGKYVQYRHDKMVGDIVENVENLESDDEFYVEFDIPVLNVHSSGTDVAIDIVSSDLEDIFHGQKK